MAWRRVLERQEPVRAGPLKPDADSIAANRPINASERFILPANEAREIEDRGCSSRPGEMMEHAHSGDDDA
jgi:hypothetical protein